MRAKWYRIISQIVCTWVMLISGHLSWAQDIDIADKIIVGEIKGNSGFSSLSDPSNAGVENNSINLYTGQHVETFPLVSLKGRGGIGVSLALDYNGNVARTAMLENRKAQASPYGLGFSLGDQSIVVDHGNTAELADDSYHLLIDNTAIRIIDTSSAVQTDDYVLESGSPWKIIRHIDTINSIPTVIGWTIIKEDGMVYRFGDFSSSLTSLNASRNILRYGNYVGSGVTNDDEVYLSQWDLKVVHDPDSLNWLKFTYIRDTAWFDVMAANGSLTTSSHGYTRASYIGKIEASDGSWIDFTYSARVDYQEYFGVNICEFYYTQKLDKLEVYGSSGEKLSCNKFTYSYLNQYRDAEFKKLLLDKISYFSADESDTLPATGFIYNTDTSSIGFGGIHYVCYPSGAMKELCYNTVDTNITYSHLDHEIWYGGLWFKTVEASENTFIAISGDMNILGIWDGYWHIDTISQEYDIDSAAYALSPDPKNIWVAFYDNSAHQIVVKRWVQGQWCADTLDGTLGSENERVFFRTGQDCFVAISSDYDQNQERNTIHEAYYYRWDGDGWNRQLILYAPGITEYYCAMRLVDDVVLISSYKHYPLPLPPSDTGHVTYGRYNYDDDSLDHSTTTITDFYYENQNIVVGGDYFALMGYNSVDCHYWKNGQWNLFSRSAGGDRLAKAICKLDHGFAWGHCTPGGLFSAIETIHLTPDSFTVSAINSQLLSSSMVDWLWGCNHALIWDLYTYGNSYLSEWTGNEWEYNHVVRDNDNETFSKPAYLFDDSYAYGPGNKLKPYLGNQEWLSDDSALYADPNTADAGPTYMVCRADTNHILKLYWPFKYGHVYKSEDLFTIPGPPSHYDDYSILTLLSCFPSTFTVATNRRWNIYAIIYKYGYAHAYKLVADRFEGKYPLTTIESVKMYSYAGDPNPIIQDYSYFGGMLDIMASTPKFAKARVSTPYFSGDNPDGYTVTYFYNDINQVGFYDSSIYDTSLNGNMFFPDLGDSTLYGNFKNGGYFLDGQPYKTFSYSYEDSLDNFIDSTLYYYSVYRPHDSITAVSKTRLDSAYSWTEGFASVTKQFYDTYNGQVRETQTLYAGGDSLVTKITFAYCDTVVDTAMASAMKADNAIVQVLTQEQYHYDSSAATRETLAKSTSLYEKYGSWKPVKSYTWSDLDTQTDTLFTFRAGAIDSSGNIYGSVDINGDTSWVKYDKDTLRIIASATHCAYNEFLVQDFEQNDGWDGWQWSTGGVQGALDTSSFTGSYAYMIREDVYETQNNLGPWRRINKADLTSTLYYYSYWAKGNQDVMIYGKVNGDSSYCELDSGLTVDNWRHVEGVFDFSSLDFDTVNHIDIQLVMADTCIDTLVYVLFDNFRFHPLGASVSATVYDTSTGLATADMGTSNIPVRAEYDQFHRPVAAKDYKNDLLSRNEYFFRFGFSPSSESMKYVCSTNPGANGYDSLEFVIPVDQPPILVESIIVDSDYPPYNGRTRICNKRTSKECIFVFEPEYPGGTVSEGTCHISVSAGDTIFMVADCPVSSGHSVLEAHYYNDSPGSTNDNALPNATRQIDYSLGNDSSVSMSFYNGLGRLLQTRSIGYVIAGNDTTEAVLVSGAAEYDARGRIVKSYEPYYDIVGEIGFTQYTPADEIYREDTAYYCDTCATNCEDRPYSESEYYSDIRGRLKKQAMPGDSATFGLDSDHTTRYDYEVNTTAGVYKTTTLDPDNCKKVSLADRWGLYTVDTAYNTPGQSPAYVVTTTNKNIKGQTESVWVGGEGTDSATIREYQYNDRGQLTQEWRVDYGTIRMIYDKAGNLRFMQNDKRQAESTFVYFIYDNYNRKIEEGLCRAYINGSPVFIQDSADIGEFPQDYLADSIKTIEYCWVYDYVLDENGEVIRSAPGKLLWTFNADTSYYREYHYFPFEAKDSIVVKFDMDLADTVAFGTRKIIVHEYDPLSGRLEKLTFYPKDTTTAGARVQKYIYDKSGQLLSIRESGINADPEHIRDYVSYRYHAGGQLDSVFLGHYVDSLEEYCAQAFDYSYDIRGWLMGINSPDSVTASLDGSKTGTRHFGMEFIYIDSGNGYYNGRVKEIRSANSAGASVGEHTYIYSINDLGWLDYADYNEIGMFSRDTVREYYYNYLGNRDSVKYDNPLSPTAYMYDATNGSSRLLGFDSSQTRYYDILGNLVADSGNTINRMTYDYRNLMTYASMDQTYAGATPNNLTFYYDENGMRIKKEIRYYWRTYVGGGGGIESVGDGFALDGGAYTEGSGGGDEWEYHSSCETWHYLYDGGQLLAIISGGDNVRQTYVNSPGGPVAVYFYNSDDDLHYFVKDHLGSTRVMVDDTGTVTEYINYQPFGEVMESWSSYNEPLTFTGKENDDYRTFDYSYYGARFYDPVVGTFTSIDKAGQFAGGFNYCNNNPVMAVDPDGNIAWFVPIIIGMVANPVFNYKYIEHFDNFLSFAGIGALGGTLSMVGNPSAWNGLQNILYGAIEGGLTGGLTAEAQGKEFFKDGFGRGVAGGAIFGAITSEQFNNAWKGKGWKSNQAVFGDILGESPTAAEFQDALDYFKIDGIYDPEYIQKNRPGVHAAMETKTGKMYVNTAAFYKELDNGTQTISFDDLYSKTVFHEGQHLKDSKYLMDGDFIAKREPRAYFNQYQNIGLTPNVDREFIIDNLRQSTRVTLSCATGGGGTTYGFKPKIYHFIYKMPRRFGVF